MSITLDIVAADIWYFVAGMVAAFGNRFYYYSKEGRWTKALSGGQGEWRQMLLMDLLPYVLTGGGIGFFVGVQFNNVLPVICSAGVWPEVVNGVDGLKLLYEEVQKKLGSKVNGS